MSTPAPLPPLSRAILIAVDRFSLNLARHWLLYANLGLMVFTGLPVLAPWAMAAGFTGLGELIYNLYAINCHQLAYRSWFLFGLQPAYSLDQLQGLLHVDNPALDLGFWRAFLGNATLGYKMAICERDVAMYGSMIVASFPYALLRRRVPPLDWRLYLLFLAPLAIDGTWQLLSYTPLVGVIPFHESTPLLRLITGMLFGVGTVWLVFPYVELAMRDLKRDAAYQLARLTESTQ